MDVLDWERVKALGLKRGVTSEDKYNQLVYYGLLSARRLLGKLETLIPDLDTIQSLHYATFKNVHTWAGDFRSEGQEVQAGLKICSSPVEIKKELLALKTEMSSYLPPPQSLFDRAEIIAFYHTCFEKIHPFLDGNGRIGRLIMGYQMDSLFGPKRVRSFDRITYMRCIDVALSSGDLVALAKIILGYKVSKSDERKFGMKEKSLQMRL